MKQYKQEYGIYNTYKGLGFMSTLKVFKKLSIIREFNTKL